MPPLSAGGDSVPISAPCPELGAPKVGKFGAWYRQCLRNFSPFLGVCTPCLKYYRRAKFWMGALPPPRDMAKKRSLVITYRLHAAAAAADRRRLCW